MRPLTRSATRLHTLKPLRAFTCALLLSGCCDIAYGPARCRLQEAAEAEAPRTVPAPSCAAHTSVSFPPASPSSISAAPQPVQTPVPNPAAPEDWLHL